MKKKIIIIFITIISLSIITGCGCDKKTKTDSTKKIKEKNIIVNTEKNVIKNQNIEGIEIKNTSLVIEKNVSKIETKITNNTSSDFKLERFEIIAKDEKEKEIARIPEYVGSEIKKGQSIITTIVIDIDLSNAKSIEYKVIK